MDDWKLISAKRLSFCEVCGSSFEVGTKIYWSRKSGTIRCEKDLNGKLKEKSPTHIADSAGLSAQNQYEKRSKKIKNDRIAVLGPKVGKVANLLLGDSKDAKNWKKGAEGERKVGRLLDKLAKEHGFVVLHDRAIPKSKANIDHLVISTRGVFVIDAKYYEGLIHIKEKISLNKPVVESLYVGDRNQTKLVAGVKKQVEIVSNELVGEGVDTPIYGVLAFYLADWPLFSKPREIDGVLINGKGVEQALLGKEEIASIDLERIESVLNERFVPRAI